MLSEDTNDVVLLFLQNGQLIHHTIKKGRIQYTTGETMGAGLELDLLETVLPEGEVRWDWKRVSENQNSAGKV